MILHEEGQPDVIKLDGPDVFKVPELAALLKIGRNQAYELVASGALESFRIGRSVRVPRAAVERYMTAQMREAGARGA